MAALLAVLPGSRGHSAQAAEVGGHVEVRLAYEENIPGEISTIPVQPLAARDFQRLPASLSDSARLGWLQCGSSAEDWVRMAWDPAQRKLHLDLNRNSDLTDDATGVVQSADVAGNQFKEVLISLSRSQGGLRIKADYEFLPGGSRLSARVKPNSAYTGRLDIGGASWQVGWTSSGQLLFRSWNLRSEPLTGKPAWELVPLRSRMRLGGQTLNVAFQAISAASEPRLVFEPVNEATKPLKLEGRFLHRLVLEESTGEVIVLDEPGEVVELPSGKYTVAQVWLKRGTWVAQARNTGSFSVDAGEAGALAIGGPLTNTVDVKPRGGLLQLNYRLIGAGGQPYRLTAPAPVKPPGFVVQQAKRRLASGAFDCGASDACRYSWRVPISVMGTLEVGAVADLGDLGETAGPTTTFQWTATHLGGRLIPHLLVFALLLLPENRRGRAWWIWGPFFLSSASVSLAAWAMPALPGELSHVLWSLYLWAAVALAVVWLLAPYLTLRLRSLTAVLVLAAIVLTFSIGLVTLLGDGSEVITPFVILSAILSLLLTLTIALTGLSGRGRYGVSRLLSWFAFWSVVTHTLAAVPFFLMFVWPTGAGRAEMIQFWSAATALGLVTFLVALPYLLLAAGERFYRRRLTELMQSAPAIEEDPYAWEMEQY